MINGRAYAEGEFVRMPKIPGAAPTAFGLSVMRIADGTVTLQHADQELLLDPNR